MIFGGSPFVAVESAFRFCQCGVAELPTLVATRDQIAFQLLRIGTRVMLVASCITA